MRFLILVLFIILLAFTFWPEQPTPTAEESFIGPQLEPLKKAEQFEQDYLDAVDKKNQRMEEQTDGG